MNNGTACMRAQEGITFSGVDRSEWLQCQTVGPALICGSGTTASVGPTKSGSWFGVPTLRPPHDRSHPLAGRSHLSRIGVESARGSRTALLIARTSARPDRLATPSFALRSRSVGVLSRHLDAEKGSR
jgi:hypothetical protein